MPYGTSRRDFLGFGMSIQTVKQRAALAPRREPYWAQIASGQHIGFRRTDQGGSWIARNYDAATRRRVYLALPEVSQASGSDQYTFASKQAREWFDHISKGGATDVVTVGEACARYVDHQRAQKGEKAACDAEARFARFLNDDPLAKIPLRKLKPVHLREWRTRMSAVPLAPPKRGKRYADQPPPPSKSRTAGSVNRDMVCVRAALNLALADGFVTSDFAWRQPLVPTKNADGRRDLYLDREQCRSLIQALPEDLAAFAHALCLLPLRPGAMAELTAGQFDRRAGVLRVDIDKAGEGRAILLPESTLVLMREQAKNKLPKAPLFTREDGKSWDKDSWKKPVKRAAMKAALPPETTLYTLRHSTITDLVTAGLDLFTVAKLAGTSILMIEKYYGHLQQSRARDALAGLSL